MKYAFTSLLAFMCLLAQAPTASANEQVVTPFGVAIGSPGSCPALDKWLKTLDPSIVRTPSSGGGSGWSYSPIDKVFPGGRNNILVICDDDRLRIVAWSAFIGAENMVLSDVLHQLDTKYQRLQLNDSTNEVIFRKGGRVLYSAGASHVTLTVKPELGWFSIFYQYSGPITSDAINADRKRQNESIVRGAAL